MGKSTGTEKLTESQARTLRNVLAAGGNVRVTQGSLRKRPGAVQKVQAYRMVGMGLLEFVGSPGVIYGARRPIFATAKGCLALHAFDVARGVS